MANAKKCDRCGEYFDYSSKGFNHLMLDNSYRLGNNIKSFDLCPKCMDVLGSWLKSKAMFVPLDRKGNSNVH